MAAVSRLHGCDITPAVASSDERQASPVGSADKPDAGRQQRLWARQVTGEGAHHKKWRIIIRNLSFQATCDTQDEQCRKSEGINAALLGASISEARTLVDVAIFFAGGC
jgi:hypothetical protein